MMMMIRHRNNHTLSWFRMWNQHPQPQQSLSLVSSSSSSSSQYNHLHNNNNNKNISFSSSSSSSLVGGESGGGEMLLRPLQRQYSLLYQPVIRTNMIQPPPPSSSSQQQQQLRQFHHGLPKPTSFELLYPSPPPRQQQQHQCIIPLIQVTTSNNNSNSNNNNNYHNNNSNTLLVVNSSHDVQSPLRKRNVVPLSLPPPFLWRNRSIVDGYCNSSSRHENHSIRNYHQHHHPIQQQQRRTFATNRRHHKVLQYTKGYRGRSKNCFSIAIRRLHKAWQYGYRDRKVKKRLWRTLWIQRIQAGVRQYSTRYSQFICTLQRTTNNIQLNRKVLADLAATEPFTFKAIIDVTRHQQQLYENDKQKQNLLLLNDTTTTMTTTNDDPIMNSIIANEEEEEEDTSTTGRVVLSETAA